LNTRYLTAFLVTLAMLVTAAWFTRSAPIDELAVTDRYDRHFKKYSKRYFSVLSDWRWFKAQSVAESGLRRTALSDQGAVGIMQVLPETFNEVVEHYSDLFNISEPKWNIAAGIAFNRHLFERWRRWVPRDQSLKFTLASYNSGLRRIAGIRKRAEADGRNSSDWNAVAPYAPSETRRYVKRIHELMEHPSVGTDH
jgi:membrane-bound lytic murein transglycosylase F